jgi:hypothetical protein
MPRFTLKAACVAALAFCALPGLGRAEMEISTPVNIKLNGFAQAWETLGEGSNSVAQGPSYNQTGTMLKRLRLKMTADVYDGLSVVVLPELAGTTGFQLLDGYMQADLSKYIVDFNLPITVTFGQFKTPFGLNRMYTPPQLVFVDYSSISNNIFGSNNFWDDGLMVSWAQPKLFKLDVAAVDGQGINLATPTSYFNTNGIQDGVARLDLQFIDGLNFGGSVYYGELFRTIGTGTPEFSATGPSILAEGPGGVTVTSQVSGERLLTGGHLQYKTFGKGFQLDLEAINRGLERGGFSGIVSQYVVNWLQVALGYDRVEVYGNDKSGATRYQAGLNWFPGGPLRISLDEEASAAGPDESLRPGSASKTIMQAQVVW